MVITKAQLSAFSTDALNAYVEDMVMHVREYYPQQYRLAGDEALRNAIRYGFRKARQYGLQSVRNSCLYLNNMLLLGSNFDADPQYPWARQTLQNPSYRRPDDRIDALTDKTLDFIETICGPSNRHLYRCLLNIINNAELVYSQLTEAPLTEALRYCAGLFPEKFKAVGTENFGALVAVGRKKAATYGLRSDASVSIYCFFLFFLGGGFDTDPLLHSLTRILNEATSNEKSKVRRMYELAVRNISQSLRPTSTD